MFLIKRIKKGDFRRDGLHKPIFAPMTRTKDLTIVKFYHSMVIPL